MGNSGQRWAVDFHDLAKFPTDPNSLRKLCHQIQNIETTCDLETTPLLNDDGNVSIDAETIFASLCNLEILDLAPDMISENKISETAITKMLLRSRMTLKDLTIDLVDHLYDMD